MRWSISHDVVCVTAHTYDGFGSSPGASTFLYVMLYQTNRDICGRDPEAFFGRTAHPPDDQLIFLHFLSSKSLETVAHQSRAFI